MTTSKISVLLVGARNPRCDEIEMFLNHTRWYVQRARNVAEAQVILSRHPVQVILCEETLVDGSWRDVLNAAERCDKPASVVLIAPINNRTWAEVLSLGGYDLLPVPCSAHELYSVVPAAWRHCVQRKQREAALA